MASDETTRETAATDPAGQSEAGGAAERGATGEYAAPPPRAGRQAVAQTPEFGGGMTGGPSEGNWASVWREFRKRIGAVISLCVIFLLITLAIFAPLLANDRPLVYRGANRFVYSEAIRSIRAMLDNTARAAEQIPKQLAGSVEAARQVAHVPPPLLEALERAAVQSEESIPHNLNDVLDRFEEFINSIDPEVLNQTEAEHLIDSHDQLELAAEGAETYRIAAESIPKQFDRVIVMVGAEAAARLTALKERAVAALAGPISRQQADELRGALEKLPADVVRFVAQWSFPVFASMTGRAIGFIVLDILFVALILAKLIVRRPWPRMARLVAGWGIVVVSVVVGGLWALLTPDGIDRTPYKQGIPASEAGRHEGVAPVLYTVAIWPPIPYGLDEVNLDKPLQPPALLGFLWEKKEAPGAAELNQKSQKPATGVGTAEKGAGDQAVASALETAPHWLGTDTIGRDTLARMLWGARVSLSVGIVAVSIYVAIGIVVGAIAGFFRGWVDLLLSRIIEVVLVFPAFFLILTIVAFLGPSLYVIMLVIGLTGWTRVARLVRGEFLRLADQDFVIAGRALGYSSTRLIFRHILPNALAPVLVAATFGVAGAILIESALSFLGIGISIPTPSWGNILADGRDYKKMAPWLIYIPGFAIFITILCYNLAGEALRDALDPRLRGSR